MELRNHSFKENRKIICGSSRGVSELVIKLSECQDDILQHLISWIFRIFRHSTLFLADSSRTYMTHMKTYFTITTD